MLGLSLSEFEDRRRSFMAQGKGWHGDSEGHAKAGRRGGLARRKNGEK